MVVSISSLQAATVEDAAKDVNIQEWLHERHWELAPPDGEWNYWHLELGDGNIVPITPALLMRMYQKDHC